VIDICERVGKEMNKVNDSGFKGAQVLRESNLSGDFFVVVEGRKSVEGSWKRDYKYCQRSQVRL
jgi:hypothetical protein